MSNELLEKILSPASKLTSKEQRLATKLGNFYQPEIVNTLLYLMGVDILDNDEDRIESRADVGNGENPDLKEFHVVHELLHIALFFYVHYLFREVLPQELLQFELMDSRGRTESYRIPISLLTQSSAYAELLALGFDRVYRVDWFAPSDSVIAPIAKVLNSKEPFFKGKRERLLNHLHFSAERKFDKLITRLAATAVVFKNISRQEDFGVLESLEKRIEKVISGFQFQSDPVREFNTKQLTALTNRLAFITHIFADKGYGLFTGEGLGRLPLQYSFQEWLSRQDFQLSALDNAGVEEMCELFRNIIRNDIAQTQLK
jgi:hypothetical protein